MNETEYLLKQEADARAAIGGTARWMVNEAKQVVDPRQVWKRVESRLWLIGSALAAVGIAGSALAGRLRHTNGEKNPRRSAPPPEPASKSSEPGKTEHSEGFLPIVRDILSLAKPVIAAVAAVSVARAQAHESNGHTEEPPKTPRTRKTRKRR